VAEYFSGEATNAPMKPLHGRRLVMVPDGVKSVKTTPTTPSVTFGIPRGEKKA
jgi:hypothetical protein